MCNQEVPPSFLGAQETGFYTTIGTRPELVRTPSEIAAAIDDAFSEADEQLKYVRPEEGRVPWSLVFVVPRLDEPDGFSPLIGGCLRAIKEMDAPAVWTFPAWARGLRSPETHRYYPGTALLARRARHA